MNARELDFQYVASLEARVERLEEDNERYADALKQALRVIKTYEAVSSELHDHLTLAVVGK